MTAILVMAWAPTAHAGQVTGNDVSYPQCGQALPSGQAFDIVAVNEGLPNNTNPCLADEISRAQLASGTCAWRYGWNVAELDARTRDVPSPGGYRWWLDLETASSWLKNAVSNRADLEGMASCFLRIGARVGIYSTPRQWDPLAGVVRPGSPLYRLPTWIPGAKTLAQVKKNCRLAPLTAGGTVTLTQWKTKPANSDFSCG